MKRLRFVTFFFLFASNQSLILSSIFFNEEKNFCKKENSKLPSPILCTNVPWDIKILLLSWKFQRNKHERDINKYFLIAFNPFKIPLFSLYHHRSNSWHIHQARKKLLFNDRISSVIAHKLQNITIHFALSLSSSLFSTNTRTYLYMSVCVCREPPLLTGNPGYCNLPRLDSTCLSAVWYRVGHCCNWSRNAIALLIIEIINGPRYRVGSYSKYLDKSRYLGAKEDVSRCSSSFEYTHIYTHTRAFLRDYRFEAVYIIFSRSSFYSLVALCKGSNIFFFLLLMLFFNCKSIRFSSWHFLNFFLSFRILLLSLIVNID